MDDNKVKQVAVGVSFLRITWHGHESHNIFWIALFFGIEEKMDGIRLCFIARREIVSIAHPFRIIQSRPKMK